MSIAHGLKWSFLSEIATKAIQPVVFIVLARLLGPEDFGVMSAALMIIAFSQIFWEAGMGKALIQRQSDIEKAANAAFWINIVLGVLIAALLYAMASPIAQHLFRDERVILVIQVMSLQVLLGALSSVHTALLQKNMGFQKLFWVRFATVSLPGIASIPLAWHGMGYWALVAGALAGQSMQVILLWRASPWRPSWSFDRAIARNIGRFGAWVSLSGLLAWFYIWADALIVGMYLGSHELGLYRTGNQVAMLAFGLLFSPIMPVLYSHLSRMTNQPDQMKAIIEWVLKALVATAVPLAFLLFALSSAVEAAIFGDTWQGIGGVIGAMALMHGFSWIAGMNGEFYRAMGKPSRETIVTAISLAIYLAAYLISIRYGFETFLWTRVTLAIAALFLHLWVLHQMIRINLASIIRNIAITTLTSALCIIAVAYIPLPTHAGAWAVLMVSGILYSLALGASLYLVGRKSMVQELLIHLRSRETR